MPNFSNYKVKDKCSICPLIRCKIRCGSAPIFHLKIRSGSVHQLVDFGAKYGSVTNPKASTVAASKSTVFWTGHKSRVIEISFNYALFLEEGWGKMISLFLVSKDTTYKIRNHAFLILVYNHPTSLRQDQSVAIATANFA